MLQYEDYFMLAITALFAGRLLWIKTCDKGAACTCAHKQKTLLTFYLYLFSRRSSSRKCSRRHTT